MIEVYKIFSGKYDATVIKWLTDRHLESHYQKRSKVKEIIVLIKARSFLDELNLEHLTS